MRDFGRFWWPLIKTAAKDCCAFANDWQWLVGAPAFASMLYLASSLRRDGGEIAVPAETVWGALLIAGGAFVLTWLAAFVVRLAKAPVALCNQKDAAIAAFEHRFKPRLQIGETRLQVAQESNGARRTYAQISIAAATNEPVRECKAMLERICRKLQGGEWEVIYSDSCFFAWSFYDHAERDLLPGLPMYLNVASAKETLQHPRLRAELIPNPIVVGELMREPALYRFDILLTAFELVEPTRISAEVDVTGLSTWGMIVR